MMSGSDRPEHARPTRPIRGPAFEGERPELSPCRTGTRAGAGAVGPDPVGAGYEFMVGSSGPLTRRTFGARGIRNNPRENATNAAAARAGSMTMLGLATELRSRSNRMREA